jgi:hypothetical protein
MVQLLYGSEERVKIDVEHAAPTPRLGFAVMSARVYHV